MEPHKCKIWNALDQGSPSSVLEGQCPAEFSSNSNQTHLKLLIKVSLGILETSRQVCWGKLELNSAGHRPSRIKFVYIYIYFFNGIYIYICICLEQGSSNLILEGRCDRKATETQKNTRYNQGMQNTISEHTTRRTLKQMGYSSRRPHRVPLLSSKNRTRRIQFTQTHQNWTIEDWKNIAWSDESRFLLHSDVGSEFGVKGHESMDPSCLVSTVQAGGGVMVWGIFSWHT